MSWIRQSVTNSSIFKQAEHTACSIQFIYRLTAAWRTRTFLSWRKINVDFKLNKILPHSTLSSFQYSMVQKDQFLKLHEIRVVIHHVSLRNECFKGDTIACCEQKCLGGAIPRTIRACLTPARSPYLVHEPSHTLGTTKQLSGQYV